MRMYDLIQKKRNGQALHEEEIRFMIEGYSQERIPDYQMSAMLMAIYFRGMNKHEIATMTACMASSGDQVDLSAIEGIKVDKHSTGGVGDKTTLIIAPIVAACGGKVAKMSGRGLGHTGGTVDKLESIPGFRTSLSMQEFLNIVNEHGLSIIGQTGNLAPADKKLYALRDVTATVDSIPLIASSIMSKKLAAGSDRILLDVTMGSGAFMKTVGDAIKLAETMVEIGETAGRKTAAFITNMDIPLGFAIGNSLEIVEAIHTLQGKGAKDLTEVCLQLAAAMLYLSDKGTLDDCRKLAQQSIHNGSALQKLADMVEAQGGDRRVILEPHRFETAPCSVEVKAAQSGYITSMDAEGCGIASVMLGAGRETKESPIDFSAGILMKKKTGDAVQSGDVLAVLYTSDEKKLSEASRRYRQALTIGGETPTLPPLVFARVEKGTIQRFY